MSYEQRRDLEHRAEGLWIENYLKVFGCEPAMPWEELSEEEREDMRMFAKAPSDGDPSRPTGQLRDEPKSDPTKAPSREEVKGWQPIETAPRTDDDDQADILLLSGGRRFIGAWDACAGQWQAYYPLDGVERERFFQEMPGRLYGVTHWMPLPAPPLTALEATHD